jgi:hypothetical protein
VANPSIGKNIWLIPDCYLPQNSDPGAPYVSHESICVLNAGDVDARLSLTFFFEDAEPALAEAACPARRTRHIRLDELDTDRGKLPRGMPYAALVRSGVPVTVQYSRLDASHPSVTLMTTMAYPVPE